MLRQLLNLPPGPLWQQAIVPTTDPETDESRSTSTRRSASPSPSGPSCATSRSSSSRRSATPSTSAASSSPTLDLAVSYGYSGLGTAYSGAFNQITGLDFRGWSAQLNFAYPIQNRTARAQSASANIAVDRFQALYDQQRLVIETEVRRAARAVDTAVKSIEAASKARQFQEKNLDAEKKRYENGMSTSFQITQIQEQLTTARSGEVTAIVNYRTALAEYYRATGRLLDQEGVAIDDPQEGDAISQRFNLQPGAAARRTGDSPWPSRIPAPAA